MKILFFGNSEFGINTLASLVNSDHNVLQVITNSDKVSGRGGKINSTPVKVFALENNIAITEVDSLNDSNFLKKISAFNADIFVVIAFRLLPVSLFKIPPLGTINLHSSYLPKYRGAAPIHRALLNGDSETGLSTFLIDEKIDTGNIIIQKTIDIDSNDNFGDLHDKMSLYGSKLVLDSITHLQENKPLSNQSGVASYAKKISKKELQINFNDDANFILNKIRAFSPSPGAYSYLKSFRLKIFKASKSNFFGSELNPGEIRVSQNKLFVGTGSNSIEILKIQIEGKPIIYASDFINGHFQHLSKKYKAIEFKNEKDIT